MIVIVSISELLLFELVVVSIIRMVTRTKLNEEVVQEFIERCGRSRYGVDLSIMFELEYMSQAEWAQWLHT
jgi:hypothetical protein